jgi:hypothetical protein
MKTKPEVSDEASTSAVGLTKPTQPFDGRLRLTGWPECLADKDTAALVKDAVFEGYEQEQGQRVGLYRLP